LLTAVVVDDSPLEGKVLAQILRRMGVDVLKICEHGASGLESIRSLRPSLATIDNQMPGINGLEIVKALSAEKIPTKLVMCSGTVAIQAAALAAGAVAFIPKPYDNIIVKRTLANHLTG
jgi:two-component system LytT family response regulator